MCVCIVCVYVCMYTCNACCEASTQTNILRLPFSWVDPTHSGGGHETGSRDHMYIFMICWAVFTCLCLYRRFRIYVCTIFVSYCLPFASSSMPRRPTPTSTTWLLGAFQMHPNLPQALFMTPAREYSLEASPCHPALASSCAPCWTASLKKQDWAFKRLFGYL